MKMFGILFCARIGLDRLVLRRADAADEGEHLGLLRHAARIGHGARRLVGVVHDDELDLARLAVAHLHAAGGVDGVELELLSFRHHADHRHDAGHRRLGAELDDGVGDARRLRGGGAGRGGERRGEQQTSMLSFMVFPPVRSGIAGRSAGPVLVELGFVYAARRGARAASRRGRPAGRPRRRARPAS